MDERADRLALVQDRRRDAGVLGERQQERHRPAPFDEAPVAVAARELERRVAERAAERVLQIGRLAALAQLDEQLADGRAREPALQDQREERHRQRDRDEQAEADADDRGARTRAAPARARPRRSAG